MSNSPTTHHILIVEDEEIIRSSLRKLLERNGYSVSDAVSIKAARETFDFSIFSLVISDLRLPGQPGTDLIQLAEPVPVLIMTSYASLRSAVETMRQGAVDYISKPFDHDEMLAAVERIVSSDRSLLSALQTQPHNLALAGTSSAITKVQHLISKVASTDAAVMIIGETGSGKSSVAMVIHHASQRCEQPFVTVNCASLNESELAVLAERCSAVGTLFLQNIGELPLPLQPLLLRALESCQCRLISSADSQLEKLLAAQLFRKDLYYRLTVVTIPMPCLDQRREDIPLLADLILRNCSSNAGLDSDAIEALSHHSWPGNLLQLRNTLQQAAILAEPDTPLSAAQIGIESVAASKASIGPHFSLRPSNESFDDAPAGLSLEDYFTRFVLENQENMSETDLAKKLGISRKSLWERRNKLGIGRKKGHDTSDRASATEKN